MNILRKLVRNLMLTIFFAFFLCLCAVIYCGVGLYEIVTGKKIIPPEQPEI